MLAMKSFSSNNALIYPKLPRAAVVCSQLEDFKEVTKTFVGDYLLVSLLPSSPVTLTSNPAENPVSPAELPGFWLYPGNSSQS